MTVSYAIGPSLEMRDVQEVRAQLLAALNRGDELRVDVSAIVTADTAGAQLLLSLQAEAAHRGTHIDWVGDSTALAARYGAYAMEQLIDELLKMGVKRERFEVKLFGGGKILSSVTDVGAKNIAFVREFLHREMLPVAAEDLGEIYPRRVIYFPHTGRALVKRLAALDAAGVAECESLYRQALTGNPIGNEVELFK